MAGNRKRISKLDFVVAAFAGTRRFSTFVRTLASAATVLKCAQIKSCIRIACLAVLLTSAHICSAQDAAPASIPKTEIAALEADLSKNARTASPIRKRRAYKSLVRDAERLLESDPNAPNRFRVLGVMLQSQKLLLTLESSDRNRDVLFDICERLATAPDDYADIRLEADLLLSERELSLKNADVKMRAVALAELLQRYRDTPGEAKSLMIASQIAPKLDAVELEEKISRTLDERFAGDLDVIEWRRGRRDYSYFPALFSGSFERADGVSLTFPIDVIGHTCLMYFWSKESPDIEASMASVKELQSRFPGQLVVFSFNLDELPGAGEKTLRTLGLDWTAMRLPHGRKSQTCRVFATRDPIGVRVNAHGHAFLLAPLVEPTPMEQNFDDVRYLSQLQSLLVGDFLVASTDPDNTRVRTAESVPEKTLDAIQACFITAPMRYRLTRAEALASYEKAEKLCRDAITQYPKAPDLWLVRNRKIIALLGMWKLACEPKYLEAAAGEARTTLAATLPLGADVVSRFCLARESLRQGNSTPEFVLRTLTEAGHPSAYAAAAILAIDISSRELHARYREKLLKTENDDPAIWPVVSFLRDQNHRYRLFKPNLYFPPTMARRLERGALRRNAAAAPNTSGLLKAEFKTPAGETVNLPQAKDGKLTLLMFVEPPAEPEANFSSVINGKTIEDSKGRKREVAGVMQKAFKLADEHVQQNVKVIAAFLTDDAKRVETLMKKNEWPCQAVMVPGGLGNPVVRRQGILSADRVPNILLLRPDGTILWKLSGIVHPQVRSEGEGELTHTIDRAIRSNIEQYEIE